MFLFQNSLDNTEDESGESGDPAGPARRRASQSAGSHHDSPSFHRRGGGGPTVPGETTNSLPISKFFSLEEVHLIARQAFVCSPERKLKKE